YLSAKRKKKSPNSFRQVSLRNSTARSWSTNTVHLSALDASDAPPCVLVQDALILCPSYTFVI
ncbi:MAG TPA: hypothetical protein VH183_10315, partial [Burkholderiaceae bacterium]|nr:hypothetical protein [Burkholderiaceae bacterium]